jgi:hypothetical protein
MKRRTKGAGDTGDSRVAVNVRVRVHPGSDGEVRGTVVEDFGDLAGHVVDIGENHVVGPRGDGRWRSTRAVWFSSTATSWSPSSFSCHGLPTVGRPSFPVAAALSDNTVPARVQTPVRTLSTLGLLDLVKLPVEVR